MPRQYIERHMGASKYLSVSSSYHSTPDLNYWLRRRRNHKNPSWNECCSALPWISRQYRIILWRGLRIKLIKFVERKDTAVLNFRLPWQCYDYRLRGRYHRVVCWGDARTSKATGSFDKRLSWLHLYRARSKITQLLIPTHAHFHWLKFIKNILKKLLHVSVYDHHQGVIMSLPKSLLFKP